MASRAQLSTSLCRSSVNVPFLLDVTAGGGAGVAWLLTAPPTALVLLVPEVRRNLAYLHLRKQQEPEWLEPKEQILEIEERR